MTDISKNTNNINNSNIINTETSIPKIVFIVPYRNRENDKIHFDVYMKKYLLEDISEQDYAIYYSHQNDNRAFNRGATKNIGFLAIREKYPDHYKDITFVFNDIDTLPFKKNMLNYQTSKGVVKHFFGFNFALGGIFSITGEDFERSKGFPNYWGWGWEDNVMNNRCIETGIKIDRSTFYPIKHNDILQTNSNSSKVLNNQKPDINKSLNNNFYTIKNLEYTIDENVININNFDTIENYDSVKFYVQDLKGDNKIAQNRERANKDTERKNRLGMRLGF